MGKIFATMMLHFVFQSNLIMQHGHVLKKLNFDTLAILGQGGRGGSAIKMLTTLLSKT